MIGLDDATARAWLATAVAEARAGLAEGGIPIGGALFSADGALLGSGHNRRVQDDDPSVHGETDAFRARRPAAHVSGTTMVTTLSPCWYCSGLVRQFGISRVVIGEARPSPAATTGWPSTASRSSLLDDPRVRAR